MNAVVSGVWWGCSWLFFTLVIIVFDVTAASLILTDLSSPVNKILS